MTKMTGDRRPPSISVAFFPLLTLSLLRGGLSMSRFHCFRSTRLYSHFIFCMFSLSTAGVAPGEARRRVASAWTIIHADRLRQKAASFTLRLSLPCLPGAAELSIYAIASTGLIAQRVEARRTVERPTRGLDRSRISPSLVLGSRPIQLNCREGTAVDYAE